MLRSLDLPEPADGVSTWLKEVWMDIYRVGQRIRSLRLEQGMTQEMLAETADLSVPFTRL